MRFVSDCVVRFARRQAEILRKHQPRWKITHNGLFSNVNGRELAVASYLKEHVAQLLIG